MHFTILCEFVCNLLIAVLMLMLRVEKCPFRPLCLIPTGEEGFGPQYEKPRLTHKQSARGLRDRKGKKRSKILLRSYRGGTKSTSSCWSGRVKRKN